MVISHADTRAIGHKRVNVVVRLSKQDEFRWHNEKGLPFNVREINYSDGRTAMANGFAIKTDGDEGAIQRYAKIPLDRLKNSILVEILVEVARLA